MLRENEKKTEQYEIVSRNMNIIIASYSASSVVVYCC